MAALINSGEILASFNHTTDYSFLRPVVSLINRFLSKTQTNMPIDGNYLDLKKQKYLKYLFSI